jgi:hypothetical protein
MADWQFANAVIRNSELLLYHARRCFCLATGAAAEQQFAPQCAGLFSLKNELAKLI